MLPMQQKAQYIPHDEMAKHEIKFSTKNHQRLLNKMCKLASRRVREGVSLIAASQRWCVMHQPAVPFPLAECLPPAELSLPWLSRVLGALHLSTFVQVSIPDAAKVRQLIKENFTVNAQRAWYDSHSA